ncbi:hypothetical protein [Achromobacter xylosoxidans]|uniref:hypothetical protein n=1 Tax=Alcaligenes xylosoxydans xylosoxydans TaxID=85698 RepID=UPI001EEE43A7|nr:hypothetical protein [Achromobacter xylosoxidans]
MAHFIVTFRLKNDSTYQDRYDSFVDKVKNIATLSPWDQTSSFFAFRADDTATGICSTLYLQTLFDATKDLMVVIDLDSKQKASKGKIEYPALLELGLGF